MNTTIQNLKQRFTRRSQFLTELILIILVINWGIHIIYTRPMIHNETESFLMFYGKPSSEGVRGEIKKFFEPAQTDWNNYQARELGYVFEYIDAQMVLLANKIPIFSYGFRSITQIIFVILTGIVLYFITRELLSGFSRKSCLVLAMLFPFSTQMLVMQKVYFRCGKTVIAFWTSLWILFLIRNLKRSIKQKNIALYVLLFLGIFLSYITDKQGVLIGLWLTGLSLVIAFIRLFYKSPRSDFLLFASALVSAFCFYLYWDYSLCPYIIKSMRGSYPDRGWSSLSFFMKIDPLSYVIGLWTGFKLVMLQIQMVFGNILDGNPVSWLAAVVSYILLVLLCRKGTTDDSANISKNSKQSLMDISSLATILVTGLTFCVLMSMLLFLRHNPLAWPDIWRGGYYYQSVALILAISFVLILSLLRYWNQSKLFENYAVYAVFLICMANSLSVEKTKLLTWTGHLKEQHDLNLKLDKEIRLKRVTQKSSPLIKYIFASTNERHVLYSGRKKVGDGVQLKILKNDQQIWPKDGWEFSRDSEDKRPHDFTVDVSLGDRLYFQVNMNKGFSFDTTFWNPTIKYEDGTTYQASKGFSSTQGQNQWYYQYWSDENYVDMVYEKSFKTWRMEGLPYIPSITSDTQHPSEESDVARVFIVPQGGTIRLIGSASVIGTPH